MVPLQLALRNFMSYGDETTVVDFRDMQVICLSGENGHGKSALLDAITWALWGETRLGKQSHDQLVRIGADEMSVVLTFQNGGETYRVRRQRSRKSSGNIWELQIEEQGGSWRSLTAQGASDTGRAITELLRMSYETFLNSAYLRQGRADEFVRQSANRRKEILAEILDLTRYDDLEALARAKMRESGDRALDEERSINRIDSEISEASDAPGLLSTVEQEILGLLSEQAELATAGEELAELRARLNAQRAKISEIVAQIADLEKRKKGCQEQLKQDRAIIDEARHLLARKEESARDVNRYEALLQDIERLQIDVLQFRSLETRRAQLQADIDAAYREAQRVLTAAESEMRELAQTLDTLPKLEREIHALEADQSRLEPLKARIATLENDRQNWKSRFAELGVEKKRCDTDIADAEKRLERILDQNETCSICGSPLPEEKLHLLADECASTVEALTGRRAILLHEGKTAKTNIEHLDVDLQDADGKAARLQEARLELARLQQRREQLLEQKSKEASLRQRIEELKLGLSGNLASEQNNELAELLPKHAKLAGSEAELAAAQQQARPLRSAEAAYARLQNAERDLIGAQARQASGELAISETEDQIGHLRALSADAPEIEKQLTSNIAERERLQARLNAAALRIQQAERERGRLQSVLERIASITIQRSQHEAALKAASNDEELFTLLAGSFGKRGVQALIIENALPELEVDANDLLQRLTDGQMSLTLQTTRAAKARSSGDAPIETLGIVISDSLGSRALEMYSGGESFRISFALRIALSKLLARHAGAQLQTLIIDEGFGTQDARGREKLVESIMAVQSDFSQIIVITHVEEIKDAFPNRIEIFKTPAGSEVNLVVGAALG